MVKERLIDEKEAILRVEPESLHQLLHPTLDPNAPKELLARGLSASARRGERRDRVRRRRGEASARRKASRSSSCASRRRPRTSKACRSSRGILTARGGMTSHAAVVARGMGKPCVAGTTSVQVRYDNQTATFSLEAGGQKVLKKGDAITIDGGTGEVFLGAVPTVPAGLFPELEELMAWADKHRVLKVRANADTPHDARDRARVRRRGHRPLPHRAHVLRRRAHHRDARDDRRRDEGAARARAHQAPPVPAQRLHRDLPRDERPARHDPPARPAAPRVSPDRAEADRAGRRGHGPHGASHREALEGSPRTEPDARPPRLPPRDHVPRDLRDAGARHLGGRADREEGGRRRAPRDHDPARDLEDRARHHEEARRGRRREARRACRRTSSAR